MSVRPDLDPRLDPRLRQFLQPVTAAGNQLPSETLSIEELRAAYSAAEPLIWTQIMEPAIGDVPSTNIKAYTVDIDVSGRPDKLRLYINRPDDSYKYPALVYAHGGGMCILTAQMYEPVSRRYAHQGLVVITPEFRNASKAGGAFPAGVEDCFAALKWTSEHQQQLGITPQIIVGGESGGGNLSIATAILAKDRGLTALKGLYSQSPNIAGHCDSQSWQELDGYWFWKNTAHVKLYEADGVDDSMRHIAFPGRATAEQLVGLVPTVILVNEFDPLKDEGAAFYHTALAAGVHARLLINGGTIHASEILGAVVPEIVDEHVRNLADFARSL